MYVRTDVRMYVCMNDVCLFVFMYLCVYVCMHVVVVVLIVILSPDLSDMLGVIQRHRLQCRMELIWDYPLHY